MVKLIERDRATYKYNSLVRPWSSLLYHPLSLSYLIECDLDILETQVVQSKHHHINKCERSHTLGDVGIKFIRWDDAEKLVAKPGAKVRAIINIIISQVHSL